MEPTESASTEVYFAQKDGLDLAAEVFKRVEAYYKRLPNMRMYKRWVAGWAAFSGLPTINNPFDVTELAYSGDEGETANIQVPHLAALGRHLVNMVVQDRVALDPIPVNTDYASEAQTQVVKGILEYFMKSENLERQFYRATEIAIGCGQSWQSAEWDPAYGDWIKNPGPNGVGQILYIDPDTGTPIREGRFVSDVFMPWDVVTDLSRTDDKHLWVCTRKLVSKFELMAQYPSVADEIFSLNDVTLGWVSNSTGKDTKARAESVESDLIPLFTFYHAPTRACPNGKWATVLSEGLILASGGLPYDRLPLYQHTAGHLMGSQFGDSPFLHGLGIQAVIDKLSSAIATNNLNLARQCIAIPEGGTFSPGELGEGMSAIYVPVNDQGMLLPKPIQLTASAQETYSLIGSLVQSLAVVTGVNAALSGADPAAQRSLSGAAMVFLESQALRFVSGAQASFNDLVEAVGSGMVKILQRYAKSPKLARIAGKSRQFMMKEWDGSDFEGFDRVEIQRGNFGQNTPAYRLQLAENLRQGGLLETKEQYFEVLAEGTAEPLTERSTTKTLNLKQENERLAMGTQVQAVLTDMHVQHIDEHAAVLDRPDLRDGSPLAQQVAAAVTAHIMQHISILRDPNNAPLLLILGQQPMPPPGAPGAPDSPPPPPGMPGPGGPPGEGPVPSKGAPPVPGQPPQNAGAPSMPKNPQTGQRPPLPPGSSGRQN
ncbi:MAG: hypothetical protein NVS3B25_09960 [Hymenobacter sp.]